MIIVTHTAGKTPKLLPADSKGKIYKQITKLTRRHENTLGHLEAQYNEIANAIGKEVSIEDGARFCHTFDCQEECFVVAAIYWSHVQEDSLKQSIDRPAFCAECSIF
jgi:uncharacterized protein YmfQ (DUF2313 family)